MRRTRIQSNTAVKAAAERMASWLVSKETSLVRCQDLAGLGPIPGGVVWLVVGFRLASSTMNRPAAGKAIDNPTVATICAVIPALESFRSMITSSAIPSRGAKTRIVTSAAGTIGQWAKLFSSKNVSAEMKAVAPWAKLNTPAT